ncbi:hypothetical protein KJY78_00710 [Canibacter sp. lx-45]|uniref:hypothetical protein n=1 Tax=Canibacter zhuwentaonis TaxID=2837491 RepID=UPI001BDBBEEF|nr:hypothetical protein [Canibacter zhuwentaonis]MBT1034876.1 hypothetical protein [Canibacter zhuwentaonis]
MKRVVSGFFGARGVASVVLVLGLVLGVLVTPQPAGALDQSTTGQASKTGGFVATQVDAAGVGAQAASLVARGVAVNVLLREAVTTAMGLFNTTGFKTPASFATRLEATANPDISTETMVDKAEYLPGDTVTITSKVKVTGGEAKKVKVSVLLPEANEGFFATAQTGSPSCISSGDAVCPDASKWNYEAVVGSLDVTVDSIPAGGSLEFKITGQAGVQKMMQDEYGIIAGAGNGANAFSKASFTVKKENVTVTALFNLTESEESWSGEVKVSGMFKCTVPGNNDVSESFEKTFNNNDGMGLLQWSMMSSVVKGSTCAVTVTKVEVPEGRQLVYKSSVVKRVMQSDIVDVPLKAAAASEVSVITAVDKAEYLPGDPVTVTSTVKVTGSEAKRVNVQLFLPSKAEGFIHAGEKLKPSCTASNGAKCPTDDGWMYDETGFLTTVVDSIPAGGSLVFTATGEAGLQSKLQSTERVLAGAVMLAEDAQDTVTENKEKKDDNYSGTSFKVKEEQVSLTGVFDFTGSGSWTGEVKVSGTLTCAVPGRDGDYITAPFTQVFQSPISSMRQLSQGVYRGSTCSVTVNKVEVPAGWKLETGVPVMQTVRVTEAAAEVRVGLRVVVDTPPASPVPPTVEPEQEPTPSVPAPAPETETEPETAPSEPEQESAPAPEPESETETEPVPPVMPEQPAPSMPAPSVPVVPETPVAPESVAPVETSADSSETGARTLVNTGAGGTVVPLLGGVFVLLGAGVVIITAHRRRSSRA